MISQIPPLKKKYLKYDNFKDQTIQDIFTDEELKDAVKLEAFELSTGILFNDGKGKFTLRGLPIEAQFSTMYAIEIFDFDRDDNLDILLGGNLYRVKPEAGRYDASFGLFLKGDGQGGFSTVDSKSSGFFVDGEVRDMELIRIGKIDFLLVARNNDSIQFFKIN